MKKYIKEITILILQLFMFYIFPLFAGPTDAMGMVLLIVLATTILGLVLGGVSSAKIKWLYPVAIAILFIPTVPIYYNESALVHAMWYFTLSLIGIILGSGIRFVTKRK